jgi:type-F conjugative transfer system pilin assembly protein TrbC
MRNVLKYVLLISCCVMNQAYGADKVDYEEEARSYNNSILIKKYEVEAKKLMEDIPKQELYVSREVNEKSQKDNYDKKLVFISSSQGKSNLENILKEAKSYGFTPVLRGFKGGSYKETVLFLQEIIEKINYGVVVDPESFKEFDVKLVPTFVVTEGKQFHKVSGNVSFEYVMKLFNQSGDK